MGGACRLLEPEPVPSRSSRARKGPFRPGAIARSVLAERVPMKTPEISGFRRRLIGLMNGLLVGRLLGLSARRRAWLPSSACAKSVSFRLGFRLRDQGTSSSGAGSAISAGMASVVCSCSMDGLEASTTGAMSVPAGTASATGSATAGAAGDGLSRARSAFFKNNRPDSACGSHELSGSPQ
jgi:hypothetical protein